MISRNLCAAGADPYIVFPNDEKIHYFDPKIDLGLLLVQSGFKNVGPKSVDEVLEDIEKVLNAIPDHQVYANETIVPRLTYLTLNAYQMRSDKIMEIVTKAGFVKFAEASPRGSEQGFFVRDMSKTFKLVA
ncbi:unnamed protein product [Sphagnum compactum]